MYIEYIYIYICFIHIDIRLIICSFVHNICMDVHMYAYVSPGSDVQTQVASGSEGEKPARAWQILHPFRPSPAPVARSHYLRPSPQPSDPSRQQSPKALIATPRGAQTTLNHDGSKPRPSNFDTNSTRRLTS